MQAFRLGSKTFATSAVNALLMLCFGALCARDAYALTMTVSKAGSGSGTVTSNIGAIDCAATCSDNYAAATEITVRAVPSAGSQFTGWLGPCTGVATRKFPIASATTLIATFASPARSGPVLDIDGNLSPGADTDGKLIERYLRGFSGAPLIGRAVGQWAGCTARHRKPDRWLPERHQTHARHLWR